MTLSKSHPAITCSKLTIEPQEQGHQNDNKVLVPFTLGMTQMKTIFAYKFIILLQKLHVFFLDCMPSAFFLYPQQLQTLFKGYLDSAKTFRPTDFVSDFHQGCPLLHQGNAAPFRGSKFLKIAYEAWTLEDQGF